MKLKTALLLSFFSVFSIAVAQKKGVNFGLHFNAITTAGILDEKNLTDNFNIVSASAVGVSATYPLTETLYLESGLNYSLFKVDEINSATLKVDKSTIPIISIPFGLRVYFGKYFFANCGFTADFNTTNVSPAGNFSGIGAYIGLAGEYKFSSGVSIFLNPYGSFLDLKNVFDGKQGMSTAGVKVGVAYKF